MNKVPRKPKGVPFYAVSVAQGVFFLNRYTYRQNGSSIVERISEHDTYVDALRAKAEVEAQ